MTDVVSIEQQPSSPSYHGVAASPSRPSSASSSSSSPCSSMSSGEMSEESRRNSVTRAVKEYLPIEERSAYEDAAAKAPHVVLEESDPIWFLERESGNVQAAAKRLATYWQIRRNVYGERFHLPLTLKAGGALTDEDVVALETGYLAFIPDNDRGRQVMFFDNSMNAPPLDGMEGRIRRLRCVFLMATTAAKTRKPFIIIRHSSDTVIRGANAVQVSKMLGEAMPFRLENFVSVFVAPPGAKRTMKQMAAPLFKELFGKTSTFSMKNIFCDSPEEALNKLTKLGFAKDGLPEAVGGTWSYSHFHKWLKSMRSSGPSKTSEAAVASSSRTHHFRNISTVSESSSESSPAKRGPPITLDKLADVACEQLIQDRKKRKRMMDAKYAQKRRKREKEEEDRLQSQCLELSKKNMDLAEEEKCLLRLLSEAKAIVAADQVVRQTVPGITAPVALDVATLLRHIQGHQAMSGLQAASSLSRHAQSDARENSGIPDTIQVFLAQGMIEDRESTVDRVMRRQETMDSSLSYSRRPESSIYSDDTAATPSVETARKPLKKRSPSDDFESPLGKKKRAGSESASAAPKSSSKSASVPPRRRRKTLEERKERKRMMDAAYARSRRQREKDEEDGLRKQCQDLSVSNSSLRHEEKQLKSLLADAKAVVAAHEMQPPQATIHSLPQVHAPSHVQRPNDQSEQVQLLSRLLSQRVAPSMPVQAPTPQPQPAQPIGVESLLLCLLQQQISATGLHQRHQQQQQSQTLPLVNELLRQVAPLAGLRVPQQAPQQVGLAQILSALQTQGCLPSR